MNEDTRQYLIIVPDNAAEKWPQVWDQLLKQFRGFTRRRCEGAWLDDNGKVHFDESYEVTLAGDSSKWDQVVSIARNLCDMGGEICVYAVDITGSVHFIYGSEAVAEAA